MHMLEREMPRAAEARLLLRDGFERDYPRGSVIGSRTADGVTRRGVDVERVMSVDHGALRIEPLHRAGWGRAGVAYGPFKRENGLALSVYLLNGHNTSQIEIFPGSIKGRLWRWALGTVGSGESKRILFKRMARWIRSEHTRRMVRRVRWWLRLKAITKDLPIPSIHNENLAVGWFTAPVPGESDSLPEGDAFVMHALGAENGELWAQVGDAPLPAVRGVQNVPICYVVILREQGAAYYAASLPNAHGLAAHPDMRPLAIDPFHAEEDVYAGVHQPVLGQIGFRAETRVYGVSVAETPAWAAWYGTAHAADALSGGGPLGESAAEAGGAWRAVSGEFHRRPQGAAGNEATANIALLQPEGPSGLIHALIEFDTPDAGAVGLVWRAASARDYWILKVGPRESSLSVVEGGAPHTVFSDTHPTLPVGMPLSLQILDDGRQIAAFLNGALRFARRVEDTRLTGEVGVGVWADAAAPGAHIRQFEAHPRSIPIPPALDHGAPWQRQGERTVIEETFEGQARPLDGKLATTGNRTWQRSLGIGHVDVLGNGTARVRASAQAPNPGRTAFTVAWDTPTFADLQLDMTPPGSGPGQDEKFRGGVIFWQDEDNYIVISHYFGDDHPAVSTALFTHLRGFEELYDAVWANCTRHIGWNAPFSLRVQFDGMRLLASLNGEPVLFRALSDVYPSIGPLAIRRVGLLANWEWGDDTGTTFTRFVSRV
ncbi:MAG: nucleotide-binding protein [Anaerolineae bacterium]|nr:nucleotide-binding protein [Anaerolineae bacterium]